MKTYINHLFPVLITGFSLILASRANAQTFTTLHSFISASQGSGPRGELVLSGSTLYGTASGGGTAGLGTIFALSTNGPGFTNLYNFTAAPAGTNSDGAVPYPGLILSGNRLYGTANAGGGANKGTVFAVNTDGSGFATLHSFTALSGNGNNADGATPYAGVILSGNTVYGTTWAGGTGFDPGGTVFAVNTNGTGFTNLHNTSYTSDGAGLYGGVTLSSGNLYGAANLGGSSGVGTVFRVNLAGTGFTNLHNFISASHGANPYGKLVSSGSTLYGTTRSGGSFGRGTVFALNTDGTGFTNLHNFTTASGTLSTNSDGAGPQSGLIVSGNTLYGTAWQGGTGGNGTVFAVNTDGSSFKTLYNFTRLSVMNNFTNTDGANPLAGLILSGNTLYGTASSGGNSGAGTVFRIVLPSPPLLTIIRSGANVILTWPTNAVGFTLQSTTNLVSPAVWNTNSPAPVVVNGQNTVTNPVSATSQFYRLRQ